MAYTPKNRHEPQESGATGLKKYSDFDGSWNEYKHYLAANNALSHNFVEQGAKLVLREGYHPGWSLRDFS